MVRDSCLETLGGRISNPDPNPRQMHQQTERWSTLQYSILRVQRSSVLKRFGKPDIFGMICLNWKMISTLPLECRHIAHVSFCSPFLAVSNYELLSIVTDWRVLSEWNFDAVCRLHCYRLKIIAKPKSNLGARCIVQYMKASPLRWWRKKLI